MVDKDPSVISATGWYLGRTNDLPKKVFFDIFEPIHNFDEWKSQLVGEETAILELHYPAKA